MTSKEGFSVVAPIKVKVPRSTWGRKLSCWALLKWWISSTTSTVAWPARCSCSASWMIFFKSLTPEVTAEKCTQTAPADREDLRKRGFAAAGRAPKDHD